MATPFPSRNRTYDVYMSVTIDVRQSWLSQFLKELDRKSITVFKDPDIKKDRPVWPETVEAIKNSRIVVVVFSKLYASKWYLNELLKIVDNKGKIIIPIFYGLNLSDVRNQTGGFWEMFKETCKHNTEEVKIRWEKALTYVINMPGYESYDAMKWQDEVKLLEAIANDILHKLPSNSSKGFEDSNGSELTKILSEESQKASSVDPSENIDITTSAGGEKDKACYLDPSENIDTTTSAGGEKNKTFGIKQGLNASGNKLDLSKIKSHVGMIIGCLLLLFFCLKHIAYTTIPLFGDGGRAIDKIVMDEPKVPEYIRSERTENLRDKDSDFPTDKYGAEPVRSSFLYAKTNADFLDSKVKPPQIQVFINFRGDVRKDFVGYLMDGLRRREVNVFIDNHEPRGEDLNTLFKRIEESGIAIVVFSTRYTESKWCLEELVKIKERVHQGLLKVLPIFYKVTPTNVKRLKGEFGDHFRDKEYIYGYDSPLIKAWKDAILYVSHKFALVFDEKSRELEFEFVETIVKEVLKMLQAISTVESGQCSCHPLSCGVSQS